MTDFYLTLQQIVRKFLIKMTLNIKSLFRAAIFATALISVTACSDNDDNETIIIDPVITPSDDMTNEGYYKGDIYDNQTGNLWVNFISTNLEWDDFEEDYTGTGSIICLDFNTVLAENPDFAILANGNYTATDTHDLYTLNIDGDSYVTTYSPAGTKSREVTSGTVSVTTEGEYTVINATLTLEDNSEYEFKYVGKLRIINRTTEGQMSNLTGDVTITGLSQGVATYWGETFTETSDYYSVVLAGSDFNLDENFGNAPSIMLGLNVTPGSSTGIPSGTYTVIDAMEADDYETGTALSGVYEPSLGGFFGTIYFHSLEGIEAAAKSGTIEVKNNGNNNYDLTIDLKDGYGNSIKATYSGKLTLEDIS